MANKTSVVRIGNQQVVGLISAIAFTLVVFNASSSIEASERLIRGQIHGIDSKQGAWVGIVTGEPAFVSHHVIPHDDFGSPDRETELKNWTFVPKDEFKLTTHSDDEIVLLVLAKNRLPVEYTLHPDDDVNPIEVSLSKGVGLEGVVLSKDDKPIAGAEISFSSNNEEYEIPSFARPKWVTAADGSFRLTGLEKRRLYKFGVTADGYSPVILPALRTHKDDISRIEIELEKGYFVSGIVVSHEGESLPDVEVKATWTRRSHEHIDLNESSRVVRRNDAYSFYDTGTRTNPDGTFRIGPFAKGMTGRVYADSASVGSTITREISAPYDDLVLRLTHESVRGRVLDRETGAPIEDFQVSMWVGDRRSHSVESNDGIFDLPIYAIDADGTEITISAQGYAPWKQLMFRGSNGAYELGEITLERARTIRGTVRDAETGAPLRNVAIQAVTKRSYDPYEDPPMYNWSTDSFDQSDAAGAFTLDRISHRVESLFLIAGRGKFASINLPAEVDEIDIELDFRGVLEGSLILPDGTPVDGVIEFKGSSWHLPWKIKSDGSFRLEGLTPDTYTLEVETDAGLVETRTVTLEANERVTDFELLVQPGWTARGTISGLEGIEYVEISVQDSDARILTRRGFRNGEYAVHGLPQQVTVFARSSSGHTLVREFIDGNTEESVLDFRIEDDSRITGWLTSGGEALSGMSLQIEPVDSSAVAANVTTTESGRYEARRLGNGRHVIHTDTGQSFEVDISGDTTFDIELTQHSLSGLVTSERTRLPVGGGLVTLVRTDTLEITRPIEISKRVGSDGTFLFDGLVSGEYDVVVEYPHTEAASHRMHISGVETIDLSVPCASTSECFEGHKKGVD